jgi:hypothetical protein
MIRYAKYKSVDYIVVDSTIEVEGIAAPIQIQINIQNVREQDRNKLFRVTSVAFNRILTFNKPKAEPKKSWWQRLINN